ncbi:FkbM family methyltransferase [Corynebacterium qintianiae]|uniref:FkbM family methyltransferase n=1 Tax=Corynebacterium qintianiae TaxID=2709392 RepID=UPI0013EB1EEC|nr:FkbM family methyltransferase [Corynebacterium qintianiae]
MVQEPFSLTSFNYEGIPLTFTGLEDEYIFRTISSGQTFYELDLLEAMADRLQNRDGIIVDVGANLGNHTVFFGAMMHRDVIAVEPEPLNATLLEENCKLNQITEQVTILRGAAWDDLNRITLNQKTEGNRGTFTADPSDYGILAFPLDQKLADRDVAAIKIDVEGHEIRVIRGALETIERCKPIISVEAHDAGRRRALAGILEPLGYVLGTIKGSSDNYIWVSNADNLTANAERERIEVLRRAERSDAAISAAVREIGRAVRAIPSSADIEALEKQLRPDIQGVKDLGAAIKSGEHSSQHTPPNPGFTLELGARLERIQSAMERLERQHDSGRVPVPETPPFSLELGARLERIETAINRLEALENSTADHASTLSAQSNSWHAKLENIQNVVDRLECQHPLVVGDVVEKLDGLRAFIGSELRSELEPLSQPINDVEASIDRLGQSLKTPFSTIAEAVDNLETNLGSNLDVPLKSVNAKLSGLEEEIRRLREEVTKPTREIEEEPPAVAAGSLTPEERFERLFRSYSNMASRLEDLAPQRWNASELVAAVSKGLNVDPKDYEITHGVSSPTPPADDATVTPSSRSSMVPLFPTRIPNTPYRDPVRIGIASMPGREFGLKTVIDILHTQADEIFVYLNGMSSVPAILPAYPNVKYFAGPDVGDRGKFKFLEGFNGYYLTCDDDIEYAPFHVQSIIDGIERYGRRAVVGWHGSIFKEDFQEFYNPKYRQVLSFRFLRGEDTPVHLLGTGVCGFHTETMNVSYEDFLYPNMADAFLAIAAKEQEVGMVVLAHGKDWAKPIDVGPSISTVSLKRDKSDKKDLDTAATVTKLVKDHGPWQARRLEPSYVRPRFSVAFIGRTDKARWKKGGILKSAHLTADLLRRFGVETLLEDIETGDPKGLSGRNAEIVLVYVGDPERPDFKNVEDIVRHHAENGRRVIVNLSYNGKETRTKFIIDKIRDWRRSLGGRVWLMVFTDDLLSSTDLAPVRDYTVVIPKTISLPDPPSASFAHSRGIFLGDIAKMSDNYLLDRPAKEWISSIRKALPDVPLYAVRQYKPKYEVDLDIDEVWPFLGRDDFAKRITQTRLMISTVKYATFEMVPVEVASLGIPVIYPEMPQSLNEHLGLSGVSVRTPAELESILPVLYHDPVVWRSFSEASIKRAHSSELNNLAGQTYLRLRTILEKD